jgi:hypothetical protein
MRSSSGNERRDVDSLKREGGNHEYITTSEAAEYLCRSVSWLLRQPDIPYLNGNPNIYRRKDSDGWFERSKFRPRIK